MFELSFELIFGLIAVATVLALNLAPRGGKLKVNLKIPSFGFSREKVKEKMEEIDKQLEEVVSKSVPQKEKIVKIEDATEEMAKKFEVKEDLLSEMQTANATSEERREEEGVKPDVSLPSLDVDLDKMAIEGEVKLEEASSPEVKEEEKIGFEESDKLLEDIAKEVEKKEEEKVDLLRDLKGQKFNVKELEKELSEILSMAKRLAK